MATGTDRHAAAREYVERNRDVLDYGRAQQRHFPVEISCNIDAMVAFADLLADVDRLTAERDDWRHRAVSERVTVNSLDTAIRERIADGEAKARERDAAVARAEAAERLLQDALAAPEGSVQDVIAMANALIGQHGQVARFIRHGIEQGKRVVAAESALRDCQMALARAEALNLGHEGRIEQLEKRLAETKRILEISWQRRGSDGVDFCTGCWTPAPNHSERCTARSAASPTEKE